MHNKILKRYRFFSIIFTFILGTLLHFTYDLSNKNQFIAVFSSVNESVWEHLKLLYFPMLLTTIIGFFYIRKVTPNFLCSKTIGIFSAIVFTIVFFYTYTGVIGKNIPFIDISSFFFAVILGEYVAYLFMVNRFKCNSKFSLIILIIFVICFIYFTYNPPTIGLFKDPITGDYGKI